MAGNLDPIVADVTAAVDVEKSATILINGFQKRLDDGINAALAAGATPNEIAQLSTLSKDLKATSDDLAAAVAANTPAAP
jgi:hypothetical protein